MFLLTKMVQQFVLDASAGLWEFQGTGTQIICDTGKPKSQQAPKPAKNPKHQYIPSGFSQTHQTDQGHSQAGKKNYSRFSPEDVRGSMLMSGYFQKEEFRNEEK